MIWGIKIFFLIALTGSFILDAMYVDALIKMNKNTESSKKFPGVSENNVNASEFIPHYITQLEIFIQSKNIKNVDYTSTILILDEYKKYQESSYPVDQNYIASDKSKVDFFLKKVCSSFDDLFYPDDLFTFTMFRYILKREKIEQQLLAERGICKGHLQEVKEHEEKNKNLEKKCSEMNTQIATLQNKIEEISDQKDTEKTNFETQKQDLLTAHAKNIDSLNKKIAKLQTTQDTKINPTVHTTDTNTPSVKHNKKAPKKSYVSPITLVLFFSNLFFMYKYLTK